MVFTGLCLLALSHGVLLARASPVNVVQRQAITALTPAEIAAFKPYSFYAAAGYCEPDTTLAWNCGLNCDSNPGFIPIASGGNGASSQFYYVGYDPALQTVIVSHQGTDADNILPLLTNANIILDNLDSNLFPGIPSNVEVHSGFAESQADFATQVLAAVQTAISTHGATRVVTTGHSLGAAISLLDAVYLKLHLPSSVSVSHIGYGAPRVGNPEFADYVDANIGSVSRVNNMEDIVPILPGRFLGYAHASGEKHILATSAWVNCPGQDNEDPQCTTGEVESIFDGDPNDHGGPYDGVFMSC